MKTQKPQNQILSIFLLCSLSCSMGFAQISEPVTTTAPLKTQKYNGYGLPNTKFKKIKVDLTKKKTTNQATATAAPSIEASPVKLVPKSSMQPDNTAINTSTSLTPEKKPAPLVGLSIVYNFSYNAQMQTQENNARAEYLQHEFLPKVQIGAYSVLGDFIYNDDIKDPSASEWQDSAVLLNRKAFELGKYVTLAPALILGLPLSKTSREASGIKYSTGGILTLGLNTKNMGLEALTLNYYIAYSKYATEFNTKPNGDPSADYRVRQRVNLAYQITEKFSFATRFQYDSGYSNQNVVRNSYLHFEAFEYQLTPWLAANITHSTGSSVYSITESGNDILFENDLKFYDPKNSEIALGLSLSF